MLCCANKQLNVQLLTLYYHIVVFNYPLLIPKNKVHAGTSTIGSSSKPTKIMGRLKFNIFKNYDGYFRTFNSLRSIEGVYFSFFRFDFSLVSSFICSSFFGAIFGTESIQWSSSPCCRFRLSQSSSLSFIAPLLPDVFFGPRVFLSTQSMRDFMESVGSFDLVHQLMYIRLLYNTDNMDLTIVQPRLPK